MARAGVPAHSSSWTPAAVELGESSSSEEQEEDHWVDESGRTRIMTAAFPGRSFLVVLGRRWQKRGGLVGGARLGGGGRVGGAGGVFKVFSQDKVLQCFLEHIIVDSFGSDWVQQRALPSTDVIVCRTASLGTWTFFFRARCCDSSPTCASIWRLLA